MDALSSLVALLKPQAVVAKIVQGGGRWGVRYAAFGHPSFALVLKGPCWFAVDGVSATTLATGDFVLLPATPGFTLASDPEVEPQTLPPVPSGQAVDVAVHGDDVTSPSAHLLGGYFMFDPVNARLLLDMLPALLHIRAGDPAMGGLVPIVDLIKREALAQRAGHTLVLGRLTEVLLVEALRSAPTELTTTGLLAGLRDDRLAAALHAIHARTAEPWSLATLAREAAMSRSSFAERFARVVGVTPLHYLLQWRLAVAKDLLARGQMTVADAAFAVGYESASGFSTAFSRETGRSPRAFAESQRGVTPAAG